MMWLEVVTNNSATYVHAIMLKKKKGRKRKKQRHIQDARCIRIQFG